MSNSDEMPTLDYTVTPLDVLLRSEPYRFRFFQAVRLLHLLHPDRRPIGVDALPGDEVVRFVARISLEFPASEIHELTFSEGSSTEPPRMTTTFLGLAGASGVLPRHYTELILERRKLRDYTLADFFDLFNHRLTSLFYRAWEKYRTWFGFERAEAAAERRRLDGPEAYRSFVLNERPQLDRFSQCLLDLIGVGEPALRYAKQSTVELRPRRAVTDDALRYYSGLLAQRHRSAVGLEQMLQDYFGVPVEVIQFTGQWLTLSPELQSCFAPLGGNMQLGYDVIVGERVWDAQSKFRIRIGPLTYKEFRLFLPDGEAFKPLTHMARLYAGKQFDFDVQLILKRDEIPQVQLGSSGESEARLGRTCWSWNQEFGHDVADAVFVVHDA